MLGELERAVGIVRLVGRSQQLPEGPRSHPGSPRSPCSAGMKPFFIVAGDNLLTALADSWRVQVLILFQIALALENVVKY